MDAKRARQQPSITAWSADVIDQQRTRAFSSPSRAILAPTVDLTTNPNVAPWYESRLTASGCSYHTLY
ncbi:hypothetical protein DM02DRAFT_349445 [Periconia macrospinosa]|uniref:Uncharacterized protein n=1 Tax=Periconia macrospinosa TaxID=97972 RepID=A0A2V1CZW4_9PLEO|nr:hypothetical protein DM02DRAFT_349445 [Periconia macrospinosa]